MSEISNTVDVPPPPPPPDPPDPPDRPDTRPAGADTPVDRYDPVGDLEPPSEGDGLYGDGVDRSTTADGYDPVSDVGTDPPVDATTLDDRLQEHFDRSEVTENGRAYYGTGPNEDAMRSAAHDLQTDPDRYTIDMHGDAYNVGIGDDTLTPDDLATLLEHDPNYDGGPIRLFSCSTGAEDDGFAQQFADRLGVDVTAPTMSAWTNANGDDWVGEPVSFDVYGNPTEWEFGEWREFHPRRDG